MAKGSIAEVICILVTGLTRPAEVALRRIMA